MVDEIGFWLVTGLVLTGIITALVPEQLLRETLGQGPRAMLILLVLGVPLYMCASASTPIAAALMLKGISPGAALVFLAGRTRHECLFSSGDRSLFRTQVCRHLHSPASSLRPCWRAGVSICFSGEPLSLSMRLCPRPAPRRVRGWP